MNTNSVPPGAPILLSARPARAPLKWTRMSVLLWALCLWSVAVAPSPAATFSGNASVVVPSDPDRSLTSTTGVYTVSCWFKLSVPSSLTLTQHLTIAMDSAAGNESAPYSYLLRINWTNGALEFLTRDASTTTTLQLLSGLFVQRWYHVAVVRNGTVITAYVDGAQVAQTGVGSGTAVGSGLAFGGFTGATKLFYGDIIEFALYNWPLQITDIRGLMFRDKTGDYGLTAYYKLGASANTNDWYHNFAQPPGANTDPAQKVGTGNITFEEVDQAGEQSLFDSRLNGGRDAIAPLSGVFAWQRSALIRPVPGIAFDFRYGYSTALPQTPATGDDPYHRRVLGDSWRHSFEARVISYIFDDTQEELKIMSWDGSVETWVRPDAAQPFQTRHGEYRGEVVRLLNNQIEWTTPERLTYLFRPPGSSVLAGRLLEVRDLNGNKLRLSWKDGVDGGYVTNAVDSAGGNYVFKHDAQQRLTNLTFNTWQVNFAYVSNRLASQSITNTSGACANVATTWRFYYHGTNNLLDRIVDPRGITNTLVQYDRYKRRSQITDALGRTNSFEYGNPDYRSIRITDADGFASTNNFDRKGHILQETDPLGNRTQYAYNALGQRTSVIEPLGWLTTFGYDDRGNLTSKTNMLGQVTRWTYHSYFNRPTSEINPLNQTTTFVLDDVKGNLLAQYDSLGFVVTNTYSTNGLLLTSTDARGKTTRYTYNQDWFLASITDPATNTATFGVNDLGWKLAQTNALGKATTFAYDLNGNVVRTVDPLFRVLTRSLDGNGNVLAESDAFGRQTTYAYDAANQRTNMVDRTATNIWTYTYTRRGSLERTINPLGISTTNSYSAANRLIQVSAPLGSVVQYQYDPNGNRTNLTDQVGNRWLTRYDELNRVVAEVDPQGDTKLTEYDPLGRVTKTTSPRGFSSINEYDVRGRLNRWTDPENHLWQYDYDAVGNITNITDALGGHYVMAYGPRSERILERNQDGKEWNYVYDALGRLQQQTDPNGLVRFIYYDDANRVDYVEFSTGRTDNYDYDVNNNLLMLTRQRFGTPPANSTFTYDILDRLETQTHAFSKLIRYEYDRLGRRSKLVYPDTKAVTYQYDAINRLTNQLDWAGRQMTYGYDLAGRLIRRTYPNGVVQTNTFDESGQLTNLTYTSSNAVSNGINVALEYAYDRNGNTAGASRKGTLNWPLPSLTDESADYTAAGRLTTRQILNTASNQLSTVNYAYDASGNMTNAVGYGQSWALAYDEDNRVTRLAWDCTISSKIITNRYDALGRRIAKTVDGSQTGYVLDLGGSMERILCDLDSANQITAYYVHGGDLSYKVVPGSPETVVCYHADAQANVIALTGVNGTNLAQYAYTPYGRKLASTNCDLSTLNSQPYTFVGSQGVMEELPGLFFMRARYYSTECGVFLSTDPIKNIGPGWKSTAYVYANGNPCNYSDPSGNETAVSIGLNWLGKKFIKTGLDEVDPLLGFGFSWFNQSYALIKAVATKNAVTGLASAALDIAWGFGEGLNDDIYNRNYQEKFYSGGTIIGNVLGAWVGYGLEVAKVKADMWLYRQRNPITPADQRGGGTDTTPVSQTVNPVVARDYAASANQQTKSGGSGGNNSGGSTVNPLDVLQQKASSAKNAAQQCARQADAYFQVYQQNMSRYGNLIGVFENTDYFTYFLSAQQPKLMANQAYSQYRHWRERYEENMDRYNEYKSALKQSQN